MMKYNSRRTPLFQCNTRLIHLRFDSVLHFPVSWGILIPKERTDGMPTSASLLGVASLEWWWYAPAISRVSTSNVSSTTLEMQYL